MNKQIDVVVNNLGYKIGTIGWLTNQIDKVTFGKTKTDDPGAWLHLKNGTTHLLAVFDPWDINDRRVLPVLRDTDNCGHECDLILTDAAWTMFSSIAEQAADMLNKMLTENSDIAPKVELVIKNE